MEPVFKTFPFGQFQVQAYREGIISIGPQELERACKEPEMVIDFSLLCEKRFRDSGCQNGPGCGCEFCVFERNYKVQFSDVFFDLRSRSEDKFLVTTSNNSNESELVPFSVKGISGCFTSEYDWGIQLVAIPSIWYLQDEESQSKSPPILSDIVKQMETVIVKQMEADATPRRRQRRPRFQDFDNEIVLVRPFFDHLLESDRSRLIEAFLMILVQMCLAAWVMRCMSSNPSNSLTENANLLLDSTVGCTVVGFASFSCGASLFRRKPRVAAARTNTGVACAASAYGFLALTCMLMPDNVMLKITGVACVASFPAIVYAIFKKSIDDNREPVLPISGTSHTK